MVKVLNGEEALAELNTPKVRRYWQDLTEIRVY